MGGFLSNFMTDSGSSQPKGASFLTAALDIGGLGGYLQSAKKIFTTIDNMFGGGVGNRLKDTRKRMEREQVKGESMGGLNGINYYLYYLWTLYDYELTKKWKEPEEMVMKAIVDLEGQLAGNGYVKMQKTGLGNSALDIWKNNTIQYNQFAENVLDKAVSQGSDVVKNNPMAMSGGVLALGALAVFFGMKKFK